VIACVLHLFPFSIKDLAVYNDFEIATSASNVDNISNEFSDLNRKLF
jgi:hypothetical protein